MAAPTTIFIRDMPKVLISFLPDKIKNFHKFKLYTKYAV